MPQDIIFPWMIDFRSFLHDSICLNDGDSLAINNGATINMKDLSSHITGISTC